MNNDVQRPVAAVFAALALTVPLALTGCAVGDTGGGASGGPIPVDPGIGGEVPDEGARDCLVGSWVVSQAELQSYYADLLSSGEVSTTLEGTIAMAFSVADYIYEPDVSFTFDLPGGQTATAVLGGTLTGDYTEADGLITTVNDVSNLSLESQIAGIPFDLSDMVGGILAEHPINDIAYSCTDDGPLMEWKTTDGVHAVQLTAR